MMAARTSMAAPSRTSMSLAQRREWPTDADQYDLMEECGRGVSATVWRARCKQTSEIVAIKVMDLENVNCSLEEIVKEAQTMRQLHHPNVLTLHVSFVSKQSLWMVEPYVAGGSMLNIMKYAYREGLEEAVIATILKEVLKGLDYMHRHGHIHRDVKAGNILVDTDGTVLLADFGVAASMDRSASWGHQPNARNTFVGTPCWMAPEVMEQTQGYNASADIWSFGITILELAHGHAPFARYPPMKVLLMTIQNPPPTLESDTGKKHFSKSMRDIVAKCLVKDPSKRPSAAQLLEHKFFKTAHDAPYLVKHLLHGLPPVQQRIAEMRAGRAPGISASAQANAEMEESQLAYVQGVSNWNFDVAELKARAALEDPLPTVPENSMVEGGDRGPGSPGIPRASSGGGGMTSSQAAAGTPGKAAAGAAAAAAASKAAAAQGLHKKQGRFEVYEGDAVPMSPPQANGASLMEKHLAMKPGTPDPNRDFHGGSGEGREGLSRSISNLSAEEMQLSQGAAAKRKGRFQIVDDPDAKGRVSRSTSEASFAGRREGSMPSPTSPAVTLLLPALKDALETVAGQHEKMKELVAAVADSEKGRTASLSALVSEYERRMSSRPSKEEHDRLRTEVLQTRDENRKLQEKIRVLEEELKRSHIASHPAL